MDMDTGPSTSVAPSGEAALPLGMEKIKSPTSSPRELSILAILGDALRADGLDIEHASTKAAIAFNTLCPPIDDTRDNAEASQIVEGFLWELWTIFLDVARTVPHNTEHPGQATVVGILDALRHLPRGTVTIWGSDMQLWGELPLYIPRMASSGRPLDEDLSDETIQSWRNQSAFSARCLQAELASWDDYAAYALRDAVEGGDADNVDNDKKNDGDDNSLTTRQKSVVLVATEWIVHSGAKLLQLAQDSDENHEDGMDYERDRDVSPGPLFREQEPNARIGHSGARWAFWKARFQALLQPPRVLAEDVRDAVAMAVKRMEKAETGSAERKAEETRMWEMEIEMDAEEAEDERDDEYDVLNVDDQIEDEDRVHQDHKDDDKKNEKNHTENDEKKDQKNSDDDKGDREVEVEDEDEGKGKIEEHDKNSEMDEARLDKKVLEERE